MNDHHQHHLGEDIKRHISKLMHWNNIGTIGLLIVAVTIGAWLFHDNHKLNKDKNFYMKSFYQEKLNYALSRVAVVDIQSELKKRVEIVAILTMLGSPEIPWLRIRAIRGHESGDQQFDTDGGVHVSPIDSAGRIGVGKHQITISARGYNRFKPYYMTQGVLRFDINTELGNEIIGTGIFVTKYRVAKARKGYNKLDVATMMYNGSGPRTITYVSNIKEVEQRLRVKLGL